MNNITERREVRNQHDELGREVLSGASEDDGNDARDRLLHVEPVHFLLGVVVECGVSLRCGTTHSRHVYGTYGPQRAFAHNDDG